MEKKDIIKLKDYQKQINEARNYNIDNFLTDDEKEKHRFVEKVLQDFVDKDIPVYIFADLPNIDDDAKKVHTVIQYNNLLVVYGEPLYENTINAIEKYKKYHRFNSTMIYHIIRIFGRIGESDGLSIMEKLSNCFTMFGSVFMSLTAPKEFPDETIKHLDSELDKLKNSDKN